MLEEIRNDPDGAGPGARHERDEEARARRRMMAGLLVETGLADKGAAKRWQSAVLSGQWDADACAAEILAATPPEAFASPKLLDRSARLERDLLMASHMRGLRGASRRVRGATRSTTAFIVANLVAFLVYSAVVAALLIVARIGYEWSIDGIIDRIAATVRGR